MSNFTTTLKHVWSVKSLRKKLLFTLFILVVFRVAAHITVPGANMEQLKIALEGGSTEGALGVFSLLTGGAMERFSIVLMGLTPYINAAIIMQLLGVIVPSIERLKKEGQQGQQKISQWTRILTVPLAFFQSYGMMVILNQLSGFQIIDTTSFAAVFPAMLTVTAGTVFMMWLGELATEKGMGNGISLLIFAGIVSVVPTQIAGAFQSASPAVVIGLVIATIALTTFIVYVAEGDRRVPLMYGSSKGGAQAKSFLPLKLNQGGMIPIIFAVSLLSLPSILGQFFVASANPTLQKLGEFFLATLNPGSPTFIYNVLYAALIFGFTYFYVSITFEPKKVAENIQKRGGYVPGYRPGNETEELIGGISNRLTFWGGAFLVVVAVLPLFFERWISGGSNAISLFISGAGLIIVVSVVLDVIRRINTHLVMQDYDKL